MSANSTTPVAILVVAVLAAAGGYWFGRGQGPAAPAQMAGEPAKQAGRKLLHYRNPMGLPDTSPVPKKESMGMDYIPVYEGEDDAPAAGGGLKIATDKVQKTGLRTEVAATRALDRVVRAAGRIEVDERRTHAVTPRFEGFVERLHVNTTGQAVGRGQPLFEVYSPELVSAQREYALAMQGVEAMKDASAESRAAMKQLADAALVRLRNWDISDEQVAALARDGRERRTLGFRSPAAGIVTEKKVVQGQRFMPGEALYQIADLSAVWVLADVFEQDIARVKPGARAVVRVNAYPDKAFEGKVAYVYPTLNADTRSVPVRLELPNPGGLLKPAMYAQVEFPAEAGKPVLAVPASAVIDSGTRRVAIVQLGEGRFEPREVKLGARGDEYVEILEGIREGETVVVAANFLIDAESNLRAATGAFAGGTPPAEGGATKASGKVGGVGHRAEGKLDSIDAKTNSVMVSHGPVPSLNWPSMTMEFTLANGGLVKDIKPGTPVALEFVERKPGEWVITKMESKK